MVKHFNSGKWGKCHCQGMSMDSKQEYVYFSFTTKLIKTDIHGNVIGSVDHILGHLGCIDFNDDDGKVYASLEFKNDAIGKGILRRLGIEEKNLDDGFYIAIFDVDKIDRLDMDAEKDGVMKAVYLKEVVHDYKGKETVSNKEYDHIHGCSGIDGLAIGPDFGSKDKKNYLHVCYGIYKDNERANNDYNIILQYDISNWDKYARPLNQNDMHHNGPETYRNKYFLYTGNTSYGIQNLEYDAYTNNYFAAVYRGEKKQFPNYPMFVIDGNIAPKEEKLLGFDNEFKAKTLTLVKTGLESNNISGVEFELGSMGVYSLGNGKFYFVDPIWDDPDNLSVNVDLYSLVLKPVINFVKD